MSAAVPILVGVFIALTVLLTIAVMAWDGLHETDASRGRSSNHDPGA